ncbi:pentapeptide repeat-containing protein [Campylobacter jejuni]|nr:pentapeptide repeat-containing protein [Campylobacter jejuni]
MIKEILEKILNTLKKCCEKTHQNDKSESDGKETADIDELSKVLSIDKQNIFTPSHKETNEIIEKIKGKEDFRQSDGLFSDDEKWYLVCKATLDLSSLCDNMNNIQYNAITQCNIIFSECNISLNDKQSENNRIVKTKLYFYNCTFEKTLNLKNIIFEKTLTFNQCKFKRKIRMYSNIFSSHLVFRDCHDNQDKKITSLDLQENEFKGYFFIKNCAIEKINLWKNKFKNRCYFMDSVFGNKNNDNIKLNFSNAHFEDNAYFNNSEFYNYADFHECEFDDIACFYGVKFHKIPNFSQVVLKGNFNALNITSNFVFDDLKKQIKQEYENFNKDIKEKQNKKPLDKFANDFRDSFRIFKNALIKDNNLLDASNFHKYELYCKEIELKNKKGKTFKDVVDRWQLIFYRKLCDHHTDLLKAFHNLLIVIMLFSMFSFVFDKFKQPSHIENDIKYNIVKVDSKENYIFKEHNKTTYNLLSLNIEQESDKFIKNDFVYMIVFLILVLLLLSFNIFTSIYIFGSILYLIFSFLNLLALYTHIAVIVFFVLFALKFILLDDRQRYKRGIVVAISYTVCIFTLLVKPSLMLPIFGSFLEKDTDATYPLLLSLSVVYFILVALVLFSLQKTARKNSIVPS